MSSTRSRLLTIIRQEFRMTAANKTFVVMTIIGPFLIAAISILPGMLAQRQGEVAEDTRIAFVGGTDELYEAMIGALAGSRLVPVRVRDAETAKAAVLDGSVRGVLVVPADYRSAAAAEYFSRTGTDLQISSILEGTLGAIVVSERIAAAGLDPADVARWTRRPSVIVQRLEAGGQGVAQDFLGIILTTITFVMLIYMTVLLYGQMIGRSVLTEKTSNTVEIMLSSVRPTELLFGKILGKGLAGILQYAIWVGVALLIVTVIGPAAGVAIPSDLSPANLGFLFVFFLLAFFLYAAGYAAIGSGAEDEQHLGQLAMPLIVFLIVPLVMVSPIVMNPSGPLVTVMSHFPFTSPIVMMVRVLVDRPPAWELAVCFAVLLGSIVLMGFAAARIFRVGILMTGKRRSIGEILRWVRG